MAMRSTAARLAGAVLVGMLLVAGGCRARDPLQVSNIQLGRSLNSDDTVGNHTTRFMPDDTLYVAVLSDEPGSGELTVRWLFGSRLVSEETRQVRYYTPSATEFHLRNSAGFPPGDYRVELLLNGKPIGTREFKVDR
jgi:hypothetical protein